MAPTLPSHLSEAKQVWSQSTATTTREKTDLRHHFERFQVDSNQKFVEALQAIAAKKGITAAQLCIS